MSSNGHLSMCVLPAICSPSPLPWSRFSFACKGHIALCVVLANLRASLFRATTAQRSASSCWASPTGPPCSLSSSSSPSSATSWLWWATRRWCCWRCANRDYTRPCTTSSATWPWWIRASPRAWCHPCWPTCAAGPWGWSAAAAWRSCAHRWRWARPSASSWRWWLWTAQPPYVVRCATPASPPLASATLWPLPPGSVASPTLPRKPRCWPLGRCARPVGWTTSSASCPRCSSWPATAAARTPPSARCLLPACSSFWCRPPSSWPLMAAWPVLYGAWGPEAAAGKRWAPVGLTWQPSACSMAQPSTPTCNPRTTTTNGGASSFLFSTL